MIGDEYLSTEILRHGAYLCIRVRNEADMAALPGTMSSMSRREVLIPSRSFVSKHEGSWNPTRRFASSPVSCGRATTPAAP